MPVKAEKMTAEKLFQEVGTAAAKKFLMGVASPLINEVFKLLGLGPPSTKELLEQAVQQISQMVHEELKDLRLDQACNLFDSVKSGLRALNNQIKTGGKNWWEGPLGTDRLEDLTGDSRYLLAQFRTLDLRGWQSYMAAASLRLRILATRMQVPNIDERDTINQEIADYVHHHEKMCEQLRKKVWSTFKPIKNKRARDYLGRNFHRYSSWPDMHQLGVWWNMPPFLKGSYFEIDARKILDLLRGIGVSDKEWLSRMPRVCNMFPGHGYGSPPRKRIDKGINEYWINTRYNAIYYIGNRGKSAHEILETRWTIESRRQELMYWIWSHYIKAFVGTLHDIVTEWWTSVDKNKVKKVALRAFNGKYVACELSDRGQLVANRDWIRGWETFRLINLNNNRVALYGWNKQYVTAELHNKYISPELVANRDWIRGWETFQVIHSRTDKHKVAFRAANGKYVIVSSGHKGARLTATADRRYQKATFEIVDLK